MSEHSAPGYCNPKLPLTVDDEGNIVDANGWLVACPAYRVWPDTNAHARMICVALNRAFQDDDIRLDEWETESLEM